MFNVDPKGRCSAVPLNFSAGNPRNASDEVAWIQSQINSVVTPLNTSITVTATVPSDKNLYNVYLVEIPAPTLLLIDAAGQIKYSVREVGGVVYYGAVTISSLSSSGMKGEPSLKLPGSCSRIAKKGAKGKL